MGPIDRCQRAASRIYELPTIESDSKKSDSFERNDEQPAAQLRAESCLGSFEQQLVTASSHRSLESPHSLPGWSNVAVSVIVTDICSFHSWVIARNAKSFLSSYSKLVARMTAATESAGGAVDMFYGDHFVHTFRGERHKRDAAVFAVTLGEVVAKTFSSGSQNSSSCCRVTCGLASGKTLMGFMGTPSMAAHCSIGDSVSHAFQLQSMCKRGVRIVEGREDDAAGYVVEWCPRGSLSPELPANKFSVFASENFIPYVHNDVSWQCIDIATLHPQTTTSSSCAEACPAPRECVVVALMGLRGTAAPASSWEDPAYIHVNSAFFAQAHKRDARIVEESIAQQPNSEVSYACCRLRAIVHQCDGKPEQSGQHHCVAIHARGDNTTPVAAELDELIGKDESI